MRTKRQKKSGDIYEKHHRHKIKLLQPIYENRHCKVTKLYYIYKEFQVKKCRSNDFHQFKRHDKQTLNITMKEKSSNYFTLSNNLQIELLSTCCALLQCSFLQHYRLELNLYRYYLHTLQRIR